jgi:glycosyltransferase involved in cell wall biosynthesis
LVYHEHGLPRNWEKSLWARSYPFLIRRVDHTIAISETVRQQILSYGVEPASVTTVHNGIDPRMSHESTPREHRPSDHASGQDFTVVQVANFLDWKGHETVIRALARLRDRVPGARVVFYGQSKDLEYEARLRVLVAEKDLKDAVDFAGYRTDLMKLLDTFDCLVLASRAEPFGLVLLEAMRAGLPVVASNAGGVPEIITNEVNGLLFEPEDFEELANALARIAQNPEVAACLRREGEKTIVDRFSFDAQIAGIQKVFEAEAR